MDRATFMALWRDNGQLDRELTPDDRREIFLTALQGSSDLSRGLLEELCKEYGESLDNVLNGGSNELR